MLFAVISDIHGCATALERALDLCENTFHADGACPGSPFNPTKIPRFLAETSLNLT